MARVSLRFARIGQRLRARLAAGLDALAFPLGGAALGVGPDPDRGLEADLDPDLDPERRSPFRGKLLTELRSLAIEPACGLCGMPVGPHASIETGCPECLDRPLAFDRVIRLGRYRDPLRSLCLMIKKEQGAWLIRWLAELLIESRVEAFAQLPPETRVVPIPLHISRQWRRGFNQAEELAAHLARRLDLRLGRGWLKRTRKTPKLGELGREERTRVLRGAMAVGRRARGRLGDRAPILLVDDILTTGATCSAAARALKKAGAGPVVVAALARAEGVTS